LTQAIFSADIDDDMWRSLYFGDTDDDMWRSLYSAEWYVENQNPFNHPTPEPESVCNFFFIWM